MDYAVLTSEIQNDPLARGYAGMTDAERLASLRAVNRTKLTSPYMITDRGVINAFANPVDGETCMQGIEAASQSNPLVARAIKWMQPANGGLDIGDVKTHAIIDVLSGAGAITAEAATTLKAIAQVVCSRAEELGIADVELGHLESARTMLGGA